MTSRPTRRHGLQVRPAMLLNWLALLALLALGIVWPGDEPPGVAAEGTHGTPIRQAQAPGGYALP